MSPSERYQKLRKEGVPDLHNHELLRACKYDNDLLAEFLEANKEFIFLIISQYKGNIETLKNRFNVSEEELLQHAYIGIISALREFDFDRGVKFTTFAFRPIIWEINQLLYNDSKLVRLSRSAIDLIRRMEEVESDLGYYPPPEEMAEILDVPVERIEEVLRFATDLTYLDSLENFEPIDTFSQYEKEITDKVYVDNLIEEAGLDEFETQVAQLIMEGLNNSQIADRLGVYSMSINRAIERIKSKIENNFVGRRLSKYEEEIEIISDEMIETGQIISIKDMKELLDVCGFDLNNYTTRILYYIRQKAIKRIEDDVKLN